MSVTTRLERQVPSGNLLIRAGRRKRNARWLWMAVGFFIVLASGCIRIPQQSWTVSHRLPYETRRFSAECTAVSINQSVKEPIDPGQTTELNADGFSLSSWNTFKGKKHGWAEDFQKLSRATDILILQEAYLTGRLKTMLQEERYHWDMSAAFEYRKIEMGVLTASRTAPNFTCSFLESEPITRIPKGTLITRYPLSGTTLELLVVNVHAINFTLNSFAFNQQINRLEGLLADYRGPLIVSGDFNTWSAGRMSRVKAMAQRLDLHAVGFDKNRRSRFFGRPVDHVYYRGLEATKATTPMVSTSDHNPLSVAFHLAYDAISGE